ncbi:MAG: dTDP-4-dehydrorhamnose 3,5-epimerase [Planctomycetota bacterium]
MESPKSQSAFTAEQGFIEGCTKDKQSITSDWEIPRQLIDGVRVKETKSVLGEQKALTEIFRCDWALDDEGIDQVFQVRLFPGAITAWHAHQHTTDRLFVSSGLLKVVLYDARQGSPTFGLVNEFRWGSLRPALVSVPPGVWHGVQNNSGETACLLNIVNRAYRYEDPDHWRLPWNTDKIPYAFVR